MNCEKDDFAVIVCSQVGNEGKTLTCLRLLPAGHDGHPPLAGPIWQTDRSDIKFRQYGCYGVSNCIPDANLRPIRDQPGNEQFVVEARKSLPRPATAKGDTITERGELA